MSEQEQRRLMAATILAGILARGTIGAFIDPLETIREALGYADVLISETREPKE